MTVSLDNVIRQLTPVQRARVEARAKALIEGELMLRDLRQPAADGGVSEPRAGGSGAMIQERASCTFKSE
jgi:hypothetical protein